MSLHCYYSIIIYDNIEIEQKFPPHKSIRLPSRVAGQIALGRSWLNVLCHNESFYLTHSHMNLHFLHQQRSKVVLSESASSSPAGPCSRGKASRGKHHTCSALRVEVGRGLTQSLRQAAASS